jgi:hypothetical protein
VADIADMASEIEGENLARALAAARVPIAAGVAGECEGCGDESKRLVGGRCAPCRDGRTRAAPVVRAVERPAVVPPAASLAGQDLMAAVRREMDREETGMRQIGIRIQDGPVLAAIESAAAAGETSLGSAALALIERGLAAQDAPAGPAPAEAGTPRQRMVALLDGVQALVTGLIDAADAAGVTSELEEKLGEAIERAETAEAKLASLRAVLS